MSERLLKLEAKLSELKTQVQRERSREAETQRKLETRKKIVLGAVILKLMGDDPTIAALLLEELDRRVTAERDREVLDLPPRA